MTTCEESVRLISRSLDGAAGRWERLRLRLHLALCRTCARYARQVRLIDRLCGRLAHLEPEEGPEMRLSPEQRDRIVESLRADRG